MKRLTIFCVCVVLGSVYGDIYLHNPRGSNNRWDENTRPRRNANRMFDSQNNDRGGYNVGCLYYYVGSRLQIEWTNQHSCGDQNNHCDIILQYMCGDQVRDGTSTSTIPERPDQCKDLDCNNDRRYGMHEDFYSYTHCKLRTRNKELFIADQNVGPSAKNTRQNPGGTRRGYECPEERDYYPYWGPTPWKDIAILTNDISRCPMYRAESQNVKDKFACNVGNTFLYQNFNGNPNPRIPIDKEDCEKFEYQENSQVRFGVWQRYDSHNIEAPACVAAPKSRDNHLGNGLGGQHLNYNWTIPDDVNELCTLRVRYNISTSDFGRDNTTSAQNTPANSDRSTTPGVNLWTRQGLSQSEGIARGYILENNPEVKILDNDKLKLQLAVNTAQYGRTFQDRSHTFAIRPRSAGTSSEMTIQNVNVRGKRGNIVQVYPAVEYDYVPNTVRASMGSLIHFQWTGSDNNPGNNAGQGRAGTDRSNVLLMTNASYVEGNPASRSNVYGQLGSSYPDVLTEGGLAGLNYVSRKALAILLPHIGGDMTELNAAGTYFDHGLSTVTMAGVYNYMCTRNNNFSNRSQKGRLIVANAFFTQQTVDQNGAIIQVDNSDQEVVASATIGAGALSTPVSIELSVIPKNEVSFLTSPVNAEYISDVINLVPEEVLTDSNNQILLKFRLNEDVSFLYKVEAFRGNRDRSRWERVSADLDGRMVSIRTDRGGYFIASKTIASGALAGLVIGLVVLFIILVAIVVTLIRKKMICKGYGGKV